MHEDPHISQTIRRIAHHTIRHRVSGLIEALELSNEQTHEKKLKAIFTCFAKRMANQDSEIEQAIKIVHNMYADEMRWRYPELEEKQREAITKRNTRNIIKQIIKEEYFKKYRLNIKKNSLSTNSFSISNTDNLTLQNQHIQQELKLPFIKTNTLIIPNHRDFPSNEANKCSQSKQEQKNLKYTQHISIDIPQFNLAFKSNPTIQQEEIFYDPIKDTDSFGHFLYGDKPEEIAEVFPIYDQLFGTVSWKTREDGFVPQPSSLSIECIRAYAPLMLAEYYEGCLGKQQSSADSRQLNRNDSS